MKKLWIALFAITPMMGCVAPIGTTTASMLNSANAPNYVMTKSQGTVARHCLKPQQGGFGKTPPGCLVGNTFASQAAYPHDLTEPHTPGPTSPRITALAASPYFYGDGEADQNDQN